MNTKNYFALTNQLYVFYDSLIDSLKRLHIIDPTT